MHDHFRDLKSVRTGTIYAGSSNRRDVEVWDVLGPRCLGIVKNAYDGGKERIIVTPDGKHLFTGRWDGGVSCFEVATGRRVWHREDIRGVQHVRYSSEFPDSLFLAAVTEDYRVNKPNTFDGIMELSATDGTELWRRTSTHKVFLAHGLLILADRAYRQIRVLDPRKNEVSSFSMVHFSVLDVDSSDGLLAFAEGRKGIRLVSPNGRTLASYQHPHRETHCIDVAFVEGMERICVIDNKLGAGITTILDRRANYMSEYKGDWRGPVDFLMNGSVYIDGHGTVYDSLSGRRASI